MRRIQKKAIMLTAFLVVLIASAFSTLRAEDEFITEIILINGLAELVDLSHTGEVLQRHVAIPDYFTSGRSHKRTLRESLSKLKIYGSVEPEVAPELVYQFPKDCRQSLMRHQEDVSHVVKESEPLEVLSESLLSRDGEDLIATSTLPTKNKGAMKNCIADRQRHHPLGRFRGVELVFNTIHKTSKAVTDV